MKVRKLLQKLFHPILEGASIRKITHCTSLQKKLREISQLNTVFPPITAHCYAFQYCPTCFSRKIIINFRQILWLFSRKKIKQQQYQAPVPTSTARMISQEKPADCFFIMYGPLQFRNVFLVPSNLPNNQQNVCPSLSKRG